MFSRTSTSRMRETHFEPKSGGWPPTVAIKEARIIGDANSAGVLSPSQVSEPKSGSCNREKPTSAFICNYSWEKQLSTGG